LEDNSSLAGRALREELEKSRDEQERRHQVTLASNHVSPHELLCIQVKHSSIIWLCLFFLASNTNGDV